MKICWGCLRMYKTMDLLKFEPNRTAYNNKEKKERNKKKIGYAFDPKIKVEPMKSVYKTVSHVKYSRIISDGGKNEG